MTTALSPACERLDFQRLEAFARGYPEDRSQVLELEVKPLVGLDSQAVARVKARVRTGDGKTHLKSFIVKRVDDARPREQLVYEVILGRTSTCLAPRLLHAEQPSRATTYLYFEQVRPWRAWPWAEPRFSGLVLEQLALLHRAVPLEDSYPALVAWDYEHALQVSSRSTLEFAESCLRLPALRHLAPALPALRRVVADLPAVRRALLGQENTVIHGDAHPGNAFIRQRRGAKEAVLLDWSRTRMGAPMEDVCSWVQSLALWEPVAVRRHDTLLRHYLRASGREDRLTRQIRDSYWLGSACNALGGALRYQLAVASGWGNPTERGRRDAERISRVYLRQVRQADRVWRS